MKTFSGRLLVFISILLHACGADIGGTDGIQYAQKEVQSASAGGQSADEQKTDANTRYWARRLVFTGFAETPLGPQLTHIIAIARLTIEQTEDGYVAYEKTCSTVLERPDFPDLKTEIPDAFVQSMAVTRRPVLLDGQKIVFTETVELQGTRLVDPSRDDLPTDENDPRVFDQDNDGFPGVTVEMNGLVQGSLYLVQRIVSRLEGTQSDTQIQGLADWSSEEVVLSASNPLLKFQTKMTPHMDDNLSNFLGKTIPGEYTCADVLANADTLFEGQTP